MRVDWPQAQLEELTEADSPITYGVVKPGDQGEILFIRGGDLSNGRILGDQLRTITTEVSKQYKRTLLRGGELLICLVGLPGQVAVAPPELAGANIARQVGLIRLRSEISSEFVCYYLQSPDGTASLGTYTGGSVQQVINLGDLRRVNIPVPSLSEQQRIVRILDEAFEGIATAKANAERNLQNARGVFESHLNSVFNEGAGSWRQCNLMEVLETQPRNGWSPPAENHSESGTPVLTLSSVTGFHFKSEKVKFTSARADEKRHYWVKNGDLLLTRSNTPELVGHVAIASNLKEPTIYPDLIMRMNPDPKQAQTEFLYYQLRTNKLRAEICGRAQGANPTMKKVSKEAVQTLPLIIAPLPVQKEVVEKIKEVEDESRKLSGIYQKKLHALDALKKSLLDQAFTGLL